MRYRSRNYIQQAYALGVKYAMDKLAVPHFPMSSFLSAVPGPQPSLEEILTIPPPDEATRSLMPVGEDAPSGISLEDIKAAIESSPIMVDIRGGPMVSYRGEY